MPKAWFLGWGIVFFCLSSAWADEPVKNILPDAQRVGQGKLAVMFWKVYDAELFAPDGKWNPLSPFALKLTYAREISAKAIADSSIEEMRKQGFSDEIKLADWHSQLLNILPNVKKNTHIIGLLTASKETAFYSDNKLLGKIKDTVFGQRFFDLWLGIKTREPKLRKKLLGLK